MSDTYVFSKAHRFEVQVYRNGRWTMIAAYAKAEDAETHRERIDPTPNRTGLWFPKARVADMKGQ